MNTSIFAAPMELMMGLFAGLIFGFVLNKAGVTRFSTIVGQLMLKDFTVMKVILSAIVTGSTILYFTKGFVVDVPLVISSTTLLAAIIGGGIFGVGMATLGYCPGTCVGALSLKSKDAWIGLVGMFLGAGVYAEIYPWFLAHLKPANLLTKVTLPEYFNLSPWVFIVLTAALLLGIGLIFRKKEISLEA